MPITVYGTLVTVKHFQMVNASWHMLWQKLLQGSKISDPRLGST